LEKDHNEVITFLVFCWQLYSFGAVTLGVGRATWNSVILTQKHSLSEKLPEMSNYLTKLLVFISIKSY